MVVWSRAMSRVLCGVFGELIARRPSYCCRCWLSTAVLPCRSTSHEVPEADMARCSSPSPMTWLARIGSFVIAAAPVPWLPMVVPAIAEWLGMALAMASWLGVGLDIAWWAGMADAVSAGRYASDTRPPSWLCERQGGWGPGGLPGRAAALPAPRPLP